MHRKLSLLPILVTLLLCLPAVVAAEANPWFDKMMKVYEQVPFSSDYSMEMRFSAEGQQMAISGKGNLTYGKEKRHRMDMTMDMQMPGMTEGMAMKILTINDGEHIWTEMDNPMLGGKQVVKVSHEDAQKAAEQSGLGGAIGNPGGQLDPMAQLEQLQKMVAFEEKGRADGMVTLEGAFTKEFSSQLGPAAAFFGDDAHVTMTLDEKSGFPRSITMGSPTAPPVLTMRFGPVQKLDKAPAGAFSYTPPEGVQVMEPRANQGG